MGETNSVIPAQAGISTGFRCGADCRINGKSRLPPKLRRDSRLRGNDERQRAILAFGVLIWGAGGVMIGAFFC